MNITIRNEMPSDYRRTEEITREAFWNLYCPACHEHFMVNQMRSHPEYRPELSFIIEADGEQVGSIHYTDIAVIKDDGTSYKGIAFGPVCIHPDYHRQGLGRRLISHSLEEAKKMGHTAVFIGGFPYHYETYGFQGTKKYGISMPDGKFYTGIMTLPLTEGALDNVSGTLHFSKAMYPDMSQLEAYDATFPTKEKKELPCQKAFEKAVSELDVRDY